MIVAITGGTGFIGKKLVLRHLARGDEVRVLSRRPPALSGLPDSVVWCNGDLVGDGGLLGFVDRADLLYHCAGEIRDETRMEQLHVRGTQRLIEAARQKIRRWVQLSSVGVYGQPRHGQVTEQSPMQPKGTYEITKKLADEQVQAAGSNGDFEFSILRPSIVFGEGMPNQSLFQLIQVIDRGQFFFIGKSGAIANYIHVDNVINALILCGTKPEAAGHIFNLSDCATMETLVGMIANELGKKSPRMRLPEIVARLIALVGAGLTDRFPLTGARIDAMTTRASYPIAAIESTLGYSHEVSLQSGVSRLVADWAVKHSTANSYT